MAALTDVVGHLDALLRIDEIPDYPQALNGLQCENGGNVRRVATAVDFSRRVVEGAVADGADLLVVHHGMFWGGMQPLRGSRRETLRLLLEHDVAVYAAHLPLDVHPAIGNNVLLARALRLEPDGGFARHQSIEIGVSGGCDLATEDLVARAADFARERGGSVVATPHEAGRRTTRFGICTGAGASSDTIREARQRGIDTLVVGEGPHHTAVEAADLDIVIVYAGHYATETLGVQALGAELQREHGLPWSFVDRPTGL